MANLVINS